jgi:hypothetical protein
MIGDGRQRRNLTEWSGDLNGRLTHTRLSWREVTPDGNSVSGRARYGSTLLWFDLFRVEKMEFLARLEADGFAGCNADFSPSARITADAGFAGTNVKDAESAELDALAFGESALESLEYGVDSRFGFVALQPGALNHLVNDVLFYQGFPPAGEVSVLRLIVETFDGIVNAARLP